MKSEYVFYILTGLMIIIVGLIPMTIQQAFYCIIVFAIFIGFGFIIDLLEQLVNKK